MKALRDRVIVIRGAGEMATGVACRLYRANFRKILMLETSAPLAVRRRVSFCEAVYDRHMVVEGVEAVRVAEEEDIHAVWGKGMIPVLVDPAGASIRRLQPDAVIDATLAKRNLGTAIGDAPLVVALGPGFSAGKDCHLVVETNRGHDLGRLIAAGRAEPDTGIPGDIAGYTSQRILRAPTDGTFGTEMQIGDPVRAGHVVGRVGGSAVAAQIGGVLRGLIRPGTQVTKGLKIGDVDPRGDAEYCETISEKARALGGGVLEALLSTYNV